MPGSPKMYKTTINGVFGWAKGELEHVGRIAAVEDPDVQYSYALSTVNGMLHLRNAIYELTNGDEYVEHRVDLNKLYGQVNRAVQHLITEYKVDGKTIKQFNTRKVLGNITNLKWSAKGGLRRRAKTRRN
jgi:hypothetical protein